MADEKMRAVRIEQHGGPEQLKVVEIARPEPGPGKVRVRVEACGLNYSDVMIRRGNYVDPLPLPYLMGREFCGTIDAVGSGVTQWSPGQRVVGTVPAGALAQYLVASAAALVPCPRELQPAEGASFMVQGLTAWHTLFDCGGLQPQETVLIHAAAGGVGTLAVQLAVEHDARVIGTASSDAKCAEIVKLGGEAINYQTHDWVAELKRLTDGKGANLILESVGGEVFRRSLFEGLADFGRMVVFGAASGEQVSITNVELLATNKTITGYYLGNYFPRHADRVVAATKQIVGRLASGKLRPVVGQTFALDQVRAAFEHLESRASVGKVVVLL